MDDIEDDIVVRRADLLEAIRQLSIVVVSLDRIGSYAADVSADDDARVLADFIDQWFVCGRLAHVRKLLSTYFSEQLGPDDMDELQRELHVTPYWSASAPEPPDDRFKRT